MTQPPDDLGTLPEGPLPPADTAAQPAAPPADTVQYEPGQGAQTPANEPNLTQIATTPPAALLPPGSAPSLSLDVPDDLYKHPRYKITRILGGGGMGMVFHAEHRLMDRPVALKVIHPRYLAHPTAVDRFLREVQAAGQLRHPNIVAAFDAERIGATTFLVMEFVHGQTLAEYLRQKGKLDVAEACDAVRQAALGLQHAHELKMVHRDIKPENLMRATTGEIKILDFGLARFAQEGVSAEAPLSDAPTSPASLEPHNAGQAPPGQPTLMETPPTAALQPRSTSSATQAGVTPAPVAERITSRLTSAGSVMGTPDYMAPEQVQDTHRADIRADIYALGCTLYQLLTGQVPFPEGKAAEKLQRHVKEKIRPVRQLRPDIPQGLALVVDRMLAKDPAQRFQTPGEVAAALAPFSRRDDPARRRRRRLVGIAVALLALGALAAFFAYRSFTNHGTLRVDTELAEAVLIVQSAHGKEDVFKRLLIPAGGAAIKLPPGDYLLSLADAPLGFRVGQKKINVGRGVTVYVSIERDRTADPVWTLFPAPDARELAARPSPFDALPDMTLPEQFGELNLRKPMSLVAMLGGQAYRLNGPGSVPAFSRDGKLLAIGSGSDILLIETETGALRKVFHGHTQAIDSVALSGDGKWLASAGRDNCVRLWDLETAQEKENWFRGAGAVAFTPDSRYLAFGQSNTFSLHDLSAKARDGATRTWPVLGSVSSIAADPRGEWIAVGLRGVALLFSMARREFTPHPMPLERSKDEKVLVAFSPAEPLLATSSGAEILTWGIAESGKVSQRLSLLESADALLGFSQDGRTLFAAHAAPHGLLVQPRAVDVATGKPGPVANFQPFPKGGAFAISPDGRWIAGCTVPAGRTVYLYDRLANKMHASAMGHLESIASLVFMPDGKSLMTAGRDRTLLQWDLMRLARSSASTLFAVPEHLAVAPDGRLAAVALWDKTVRLHVVGDDKAKPRLWRHSTAPLRLVYTPDGKVLFAAGQDGKVLSFDVEQARDREAYATTANNVYGLTLDRSGKYLAAGGDKGQIHVWEVGTGRLIRIIDGHAANGPLEPTAVRALVSTPDNRWLISGGGDGTVRIWDWETKDLVHRLHGLTGEAASLAVSPDGRLLAVAGSDGQMLLFDLTATTPRRLMLRPARKGLTEYTPIPLAFSPEGRYLAAGQRDATAHVYRLAAPGDLVDMSDATSGLILETSIGDPDDRLATLALLPDGVRMVGHDVKGQLHVFSLETGKKMLAPRKDRPGAMLAVSADGKVAWTASRSVGFGSTVLRRFDLERDDAPHDTKIQPPLALNGLGQTIVVDFQLKKKLSQLKLIDQNAKEIWALPVPAPRLDTAAALGPDGRWALVAGGRQVYVLNVAEQKLQRLLPLGLGFEPPRFAFSPDGKLAAWLSDRHTITVYDLDGDRALCTLAIATPIVRELAFSGDRRHLLVAGNDDAMALFDVTRAEMVDAVRVPLVTRAVFAPDHGRLVTAHLIASPRLWKVPK